MDHAPLQAGHRLDSRYIIIRALHGGDQGAIYEARDLHAPAKNQQRVIKETLLDRIEDSSVEIVHELDDRTRLMSTLTHHGIARTYGGFQAQDRYFTVHEYIHGRDLEDILNDSTTPLPLEAIVQWGIDLCEALHYLHMHEPGPIIYRDMKPANIVIDSQLRARLVDFGIAGVFPDRFTPAPLGTDGYAAPEQYNGAVTPAIDVYGLGATLHHLLTRADPRLFPACTFEQRPVRHFNPDVPPVLESIVMRALVASPQARYTSAAGMLEALRALQNDGAFRESLT